MGKNKLGKFSDNKQSPNVIEAGKPLYEAVKGNWSSFFQNDNKIVTELACGWGEYTIGLAEKFPNQNFVGVDLKGDRIWRGSQYALKNGLTNVAFLRTHINNLDKHFGQGEIDEIWLTFPDPRPKERDEKHRLTNSFFFKKYRDLLDPEGWFRFKTDSTFLFDYTLGVIADFPKKEFQFTVDLYSSEFLDEHHDLSTKYERIWTEKGEKIKYLKFKFDR